jgi:hypothetical protein
VVADDQRLVVGGVRDLVVGEDVRGHVAVGDLALGEIEFCPLSTDCTFAR